MTTMAEKRQSRAKTPVASKTETDTTQPVELKTMAGVGEEVEIDGKTYEVPPFSLSKSEKAGEHLTKIPLLLLCYAATSNGLGEYDEERAISLLNRVTGRPSGIPGTEDYMPEYEIDDMAYQFSIISMKTSHDTLEHMAHFAHIALSRRHKDLKFEDVFDALDYDSFMKILKAIFRANTNLKNRF